MTAHPDRLGTDVGKRSPRKNRGIETSLIRAILELLTLHGCVAVRFNNQPTMQLSRSGDNVKFLGYRKLNNRRGISDVCGVAPNGRSIWIEAKTKDGMVSEDQRDFLDDVHQNGAIAMVARSIEDAAAMVAMQSGSKWKAEMERTW